MTKTEMLLLVALPALFIATWIVLGEVLYLPIVLIAGLILYWSLGSLRVWLALTILGHAVLFFQKTEGVSVTEIGFACFVFGFLALWFCDRWMGQQQSFSWAPGDKALFLFLIVSTFSIIPAILFENKLQFWLREWNVFLGLLLYFPLREVLHDRRGRMLVLGSLVLLAAAIAVVNFIQYRSGALFAQFVWELIGARKAGNEPLFMTMILGGAAAWMTARNAWTQFLCLVVVSFFSVALIFTFSRGYWIATLVGAGIIFLLARREEKTRLMWLAAIVVIAGSLMLLIFFYEIFSGLLATIGYRFFTASKGAEDISLANRFVEYEAIWQAILDNPVVGVGLGGEFSFYNLLRKSTQHTIYSHNAYLYLWFKLGIVGLITFLIAYLVKVREAIRLMLKSPSSIDKQMQMRPFVLASIAILIAMLQLSFTSPQFYTRDSILVMSICWATIASFKGRSG